MSYSVSQVLEFINQWAPFNTAESWDNVGLQIGEGRSKVESILISLDLDKNALSRLKEHHYDLVITHHPLIFRPLSKIAFDDDMGQVLTVLLTERTSFICAHTNLDKAEDGVNDCLMEAFGVSSLGKKHIGEDIGLYVKNKEALTIDDLSKKFPVQIRGYKGNECPKKLGFCGGSGHGLLKNILRKGIDCFVTGEVNYHDEVFCELNKITLLLMGHKESELFIISKIKEKLKSHFEGVKIDVCL